jgi:hypothetical protein
MKLIPLTLAVLATATFSYAADGDDTAKRSAELQVLDRFVGSWDIDVTIKLANGEANTSKTTEKRAWSLGGEFVHFQNPAAENPQDPEFHMLVTYDPATKTYPGVMMFGGNRTLTKGTWDQKRNTMTFHGSSPDDGGSFVFKNRFIDKDHSESTGILKNAKWVVFMEMTQKQTRRVPD